MSASPVTGVLTTVNGSIAFNVAANEQLDLRGGQLVRVRNPGLTAPTY